MKLTPISSSVIFAKWFSEGRFLSLELNIHTADLNQIISLQQPVRTRDGFRVAQCPVSAPEDCGQWRYDHSFLTYPLSEHNALILQRVSLLPSPKSILMFSYLIFFYCWSLRATELNFASCLQ